MSAGFAAADMNEQEQVPVEPSELLQLMRNMLRMYEIKNVLQLIVIAQEKNDEEDRQIAARGRAQ
jgi:hypothetical protein